MGQKVHPEVFKLSRTSGWKSKHYEKKAADLRIQIQKNFELNEFIKRFFNRIGLKVHTCKLNYLNNRINMYVSYTKNRNLVDGVSKFTRKKTKQTRKIKKSTKVLPDSQELITQKLKNFYFLTFLSNATFSVNTYRSSATNPKKRESTVIAYRKFLNTTKFLTTNSGLLQLLIFYLKFFKTSFRKVVKRAIQIFKLPSLKKTQKSCRYNFLTTFFQIIILFSKKNLRFSLIFKFLNNNLKKSKPEIKKKALKKKVFAGLRRYNRKKFFKEGLNLIILLASQKESAKTLSSFIAKSLNNFKKHKFLLTYIKKSLRAFAQKRKGAIKKLTIQLKGRINGRDRARSYTIEMKKQASLISIGSRINYSESTTFTPDGTLSVKVWLEYRKIKLCKLRRKKSKRLRLIKLLKLRLKMRKLKPKKAQELLRRKELLATTILKLSRVVVPKHGLRSKKLCKLRRKKSSIKKRRKVN